MRFSEEYLEYMKSDEWKERRLQILESADYTCEECEGVATCVHHISYKHLGDEYDEELQPLCEDCHKEKHGLEPGQAWSDLDGVPDYMDKEEFENEYKEYFESKNPRKT